MKKKLIIWEFGGLIVSIGLWIFFHYGYEWTKEMGLSLICAVNTSVWEHLKIGFFAIFILYLIQAFFIGRYLKNFWFAKLMGLLIVPLVTMILYYTYSGILGYEIPLVNIINGIIGFIVAQIISYFIISSEKEFHQYNMIWQIGILSLTLVFFVFTYYPLKLDLFKDGNTGKYGYFNF